MYVEHPVNKTMKANDSKVSKEMIPSPQDFDDDDSVSLAGDLLLSTFLTCRSNVLLIYSFVPKYNTYRKRDIFTTN